MITKIRNRFSAVVESGSCSMDRKRWEERAHCGHKHRTYAAAEKCGEKHRGAHYSATGSWECSALWYHFSVHNQFGECLGGQEDFWDDGVDPDPQATMIKNYEETTGEKWKG